eukprot:764056-Hanusia_phi.AAC.7
MRNIGHVAFAHSHGKFLEEVLGRKADRMNKAAGMRRDGGEGGGRMEEPTVCGFCSGADEVAPTRKIWRKERGGRLEC